jgi:hypothetical protein
MPAFIITRIQTGDYDLWRPMFDQDQPGARETAGVQRVLRSVDDPNEIFIYLEYPSLEDANEARARASYRRGCWIGSKTSTARTCSSTLADTVRLPRPASGSGANTGPPVDVNGKPACLGRGSFCYRTELHHRQCV